MSRDEAELWAFRVAVALVGLYPAAGAVLGIFDGAGMAGDLTERAVSLDSHVRYLSGLLLGVTIAFWATLRDPARHAGRYRLLTAIIVLGGIARLYGIATVGTPSAAMLFGLLMELVVTPAVCLWQARIARLTPPPSSARAAGRS